MRSTCSGADCCLTLLAPPDPASSDLDRAHASLRRVLYSIFGHFSLHVYSYLVHINLCEHDKLSCTNLSKWRGRLLFPWPGCPWLKSRMIFFLFSVTFPVFLFQCKKLSDDDWGVVWAIEKSVICAYIVLLLCGITVVSYVDTAYGLAAEYLDLIDYSYTVRCCTTYE